MTGNFHQGTPKPFSIRISEDILADLRARLAHVRWPDEVSGSDWKYGANLRYVRELMRYWHDTYDWRAHEGRLNEFDQYTVSISGIDLHFIHVVGVGPDPIPLLLPHGWPGSIVEFEKIIPMLTDPARFGGDAKDAFTVIAPSLPGHGFSFKPNQPRFGIVDIAHVFATLMTDVLGYPKFAAQGGDWGAFINSSLAINYPERLIGIHLNLLAMRRDIAMPENPTAEELRFFSELSYWQQEERGYSAIMGTKPQTLSFALMDSPVGLAAWIIEKFYTWSDCDGDLDSYFGKDTLLTNIMFYWATGAIGSTFWPYYARHHGQWPIMEGQRVNVPTGYASFPKDIIRPPRSIADRYYNIRHWTDMPKGGHFAALEQPRLLAEDIRKFFRNFR